MPGFTDEERRLWSAAMLVQMRLRYEMNHQLSMESDLSLNDFGILLTLNELRPEPMALRPLAARLGWELSRLSHHVRRMEQRGLVATARHPEDRRSTTVRATTAGQRTFESAIEGHAALVRRLYLDAVPEDAAPQMCEALEAVYASLLEHGTLPAPAGSA
jgi:DNA-binding MarR family transcriptional regulator